MESTTLRKGDRAGGYPVRSETLHHGAKSTYTHTHTRNKAVYSGFITLIYVFPEGCFFRLGFSCPRLTSHRHGGRGRCPKCLIHLGNFLGATNQRLVNSMGGKQLGNCSPKKSALKKLRYNDFVVVKIVQFYVRKVVHLSPDQTVSIEF